jgi:hypothetical protein
MVSLLRFLIGTGVLLALSACASYQVSQDYDPAYDFTKLKTYDWIPNPEVTAQAELIEKHIRKAMEEQLAEKGYTISSDNPDFYVAMHLGSEKRTSIQSWGYGYGYWNAGVDVYQYDEGTLAFDFVDGKQKSLFYRSVVKAEVKHDIKFEERQRRINKAVKKVLKYFPPDK